MNNENFENDEAFDELLNHPFDSNDNQIIRYCLCILIVAIAIIFILIIQTGDYSENTNTDIAIENTNNEIKNQVHRKIIIDNKTENESTSNAISPGLLFSQLSNGSIAVVSNDKITVKVTSGNPTTYFYFDENDILTDVIMEIVCNSQYEVDGYMNQLKGLDLESKCTITDNIIHISFIDIFIAESTLDKSQIIKNLSREYYIEYDNN